MFFSADFMVSIKLKHACAFNLQFHFYNSIEMLLGHKDMCVRMIITALFTIPKNICNDEYHELGWMSICREMTNYDTFILCLMDSYHFAYPENLFPCSSFLEIWREHQYFLKLHPVLAPSYVVQSANHICNDPVL